MKRILFTILLATALLGCQHEGDDAGTPVLVTTLQYDDGSEVRGDSSGIIGKRLQVVSNLGDFTTLWDEHVSTMSPMPAQPSVDFSTQMVIAAFTGQRASGGYTVEIGAVTEFDEFIDVIVHHQAPGDSCASATVLTQPHHMVVVPDSSKPIVFSEIYTQATSC